MALSGFGIELRAGQFDLMDADAVELAAQSRYFGISDSTIRMFPTTNFNIFTTIQGDTMIVPKIPTKTTAVSDGPMVATNFILDQNYPNPFNMTTMIRFSLPEQSTVKIIVYDITGKQIATLVDGMKAAGVHSIGFGNEQLSTGVYFYRMIARTVEGKQLIVTKKMVVMK